MSEQRLAVIGSELESRLLATGEKIPAKRLCYRNWSECLAAMQEAAPSVVIGAMPGDTAFDQWWQQRLQQQDAPALVLLAAPEHMDRALELFQAGAYDYLPTEADGVQVIGAVTRALHRSRPKPVAKISAHAEAGTLIGDSNAVQELHRAVQQLSKIKAPVLVRGEPGTGKQLFARLLHERSECAGPLVVVNLGAIARSSLDAELFGLERADGQIVRHGRVEEAEGGTLFLDEIAELPLDTQLRLAQLLAESQFHRVGGYGLCQASVRIVAATRHPLETLVRNGQFQPDLYHRLTVVQVQLPRLQERKEDIAPLAQHFFSQVANELAVPPKQFAADVWPVLQQYEWPGNVRQLENLCRQLAVMSAENLITAAQLPLEMQPELQIANEARGWEDALKSWAEQSLAAGHRNLLDVAQPVLERILLQAALKQTGGLKQEAALLLGWGRNTLTRKLRELAIETDDDEDLD